MSYVLGIATYGVGVLLMIGYLLAWKLGSKAEAAAHPTEDYTSIIED